MTTCLPRAQGVPGLPTAPNWFDTAPGAPPQRTEIDDPRWTGAYNRGFGDGTGLEAQFRGVYMDSDWRGRKSLFLSWRVLYDGRLDNGLDRLYVGFNNGGANAADTLILKVVAYNSSAADIVAGTPGSVQALAMNAASGEGTPLAGNPAWLNQTKAWLQRTPIGWALHMYVPYDPAAAGLFSDQGIKLPDPFRFFYQLYVLTPTRISGGAATGGFVVHKWPTGAASVATGLSGDVYPHPAAAPWDEFHPSTGPGDPMCPTTGGVSIVSSGLGNMVNGGAPNIVIRYSNVAPFPVNTLFANVDNQTGAPIPAGAIKARFRIADWDSVIADPAAPWQDVRGGGAVSNAVPIPVGKPTVTAGNPPPLHFDWQLNAAERAPYLAGKPSDQCILVELSGAGLTFFNDSARQNHLILPASTVVRRAQISIEGLAPLPGSGGRRDVYLAIETRNMPAPGGSPDEPPQPEEPPSPDRIGLAAAAAGSARGTGNEQQPRPKEVWDAEKLAILRRRKVNPEALEVLAKKGLLAALDTGKLDFEAVADLQPTYRVHVYHDTGDRLRVDGIDYPILAAQSSFGLLPDHVGPLTGWQHQLQLPPGALQEEITPALLRVHVPDHGKIHTTVRVEAVEPPSPDEPKWPWWVWLLWIWVFWIWLRWLRGGKD